MSIAVSFSQVARHYGSVKAVDYVDLEIEEGSFFAMLGPSGSGKTTCLRLISGFESPDSGQVTLFGQDVSRTPPNLRNVNTVFQDYALFPHMNIRDNVAYGPMVAGVGKRERYNSAEEMLALVELDNLGDRKPGQLSGGQRQRVALARALINKPRVLLLDEPLGALDLKLREAMQYELKALQAQLGITFVFVTHDQHEALSMADQLAIFNEGKIAQIGKPQDLYNKPDTAFVANFIGSSNVFAPEFSQKLLGRAQWVSLRPEKVTLCAPNAGRITGTVSAVRYLGEQTRIQVLSDDQTIAANLGAHDTLPQIGASVGLEFDLNAIHEMKKQ